jgi:hypothetical protein
MPVAESGESRRAAPDEEPLETMSNAAKEPASVPDTSGEELTEAIGKAVKQTTSSWGRVFRRFLRGAGSAIELLPPERAVDFEDGICDSSPQVALARAWWGVGDYLRRSAIVVHEGRKGITASDYRRAYMELDRLCQPCDEIVVVAASHDIARIQLGESDSAAPTSPTEDLQLELFSGDESYLVQRRGLRPRVTWRKWPLPEDVSKHVVPEVMLGHVYFVGKVKLNVRKLSR